MDTTTVAGNAGDSSFVFTTVALISFLAVGGTALVALVLALYTGRQLSRVDKLIIWWLYFDIGIHYGLEGPFIYISLASSVAASQSFLAEPWKEYGKADRRWLYSDPGIVSLEGLTVVLVTPLCVLLIYAIFTNKYYRHWLQLFISICELYGGWMTFAPQWLVGSPDLVSSYWVYLVFYLIFFNGIWVVIPLLLIAHSWFALRQLFHDAQGHRYARLDKEWFPDRPKYGVNRLPPLSPLYSLYRY